MFLASNGWIFSGFLSFRVEKMFPFLSSPSASVHDDILPQDEPRTGLSPFLPESSASVNGEPRISLSSFPPSSSASVNGEPRTTLSSNRVSESCYGDESDEDGTYQGMILENESEGENDGFGNDEQVVVASDSYRWKINHSKGDHKLKGQCSYQGRATVTKRVYTVQDLIEKTSLEFRRRAGHRHVAKVLHHGLWEQQGRIQACDRG